MYKLEIHDFNAELGNKQEGTQEFEGSYDERNNRGSMFLECITRLCLY